MAETGNAKTQWPSLGKIRSFLGSEAPEILTQFESEIKQLEATLAQVTERRKMLRDERRAATQLRLEQERQAAIQEEALEREISTSLFKSEEGDEPHDNVVNTNTEEPKPATQDSPIEPAKQSQTESIKAEDQPKQSSIDSTANVEPSKTDVTAERGTDTTEPQSTSDKVRLRPTNDTTIKPLDEKTRQRPSTADNDKNGGTTHSDDKRKKNRNDRNRSDTNKNQTAAQTNNRNVDQNSYAPITTRKTSQPVLSEAEKEKILNERQRLLKDQLNANLFQSVSKPLIDKPVIKIYVPPADEKRPNQSNRPNDKYNHNTGNASRPAGGYSQNNQGRYNNPNYNKTGAATRPTDASQDLARQHNKIKQLANALSRVPQATVPPTKTVKKKPDVNKNASFEGKRSMDKKTLTKKGYLTTNTAAFDYDELGQIKKIRARKSTDKKRNVFIQPTTNAIQHAVLTKDTITIKELSEKIGKTGSEIIRQLFLLNIIKTINDIVDFETAELVAIELGITLELQRAETVEERAIAYHDDEQDDLTTTYTRPPVVTIMGHVDHGKTSILDYIRKANVAGGEAGGITQHIGAYSVSIGNSSITFLDTPGHAAFTAMRARGANVTDIVIIVIAGDDGIMPQTVEAINHAKAAKVSIIVALNKMDKAGIDVDKIYSQLSDYDLLPEDWGGSTPVIKMSAKSGEGIPELLETILTIAEISDFRANPDRKAKGTIVEARLDKGKGPMATVLVQNGTLHISDYVVAGVVTGKIRAMIDSTGRNVLTATPSSAVSILGLSDVPEAGDQLMVVENEKMMRQIADTRASREQEKRINTSRGVSLDDVFKGLVDGKLKSLNLIIKADVQGSVEAIKDTLLKLSNDEIKVSVVHAVAGAINESDVMLADTTSSIIIGFNVRPDVNAKALAERSSIDIRLYRIIYDAIDDVKMAIKGLSAPKFREVYLGKAEVREIFKITGVGVIAGCMVKDGKIVRNAKVRLIRDNIVIADTQISSLKRMKDDAKEVANGFECGIGLDNFNDIKIGDIIESFNLVQDMEG
ncbi:MAG: translation initiation factor IF-2 [Christensenellaceae bacterium]|jgi:translation initiation factor IF-2|nr:translation initiation factor IF-2 [Christensenellaceae bacterium]